MYKVKVGIIGDFNKEKPYHVAINEAVRHCGESLSMKAEETWLPTQSLENDTGGLSAFDAFWCAPGSPYKSFEGAVNAIRFARENNIPFLGTCGGFQHAVLEYAMNVLGIKDVGHQELNPRKSEMVVTALACCIRGQSRRVFLEEGSLVREAYGSEETEEFFNCGYGLSPEYLSAFENSGFVPSGRDDSGGVRVLELQSKQFYVATLFQPQVSSTLENPHKLIMRYLLEAKRFHGMKR